MRKRTRVPVPWAGSWGALLAIALSIGHVWADVPRTISYQGKLTETNGAPLVGEHMATLRLYDAADGGTTLWEEQHAISLAAADNGVFAIVLGATTPFGQGITFNEPLWLTIEVDGGGEFSPRQPLSSVGYAINADMLDGLDATALLASAGQGDITGVSAGAGLAGGGTEGEVALAVGAGTGIVVEADAVSVDVGTTAGKIVQLDGDGALPAVSGANLTGLNAAALTSGTVDDARLSANVSLLGSSIGTAELEDGAVTSAKLAADSSVHSLAAAGQPQLMGDVTLSAGANVTLTQSGQDIQIATTGGVSAGNRATAFASSTVELEGGADTNLLSVTITKSQAGSALLLIATAQLNHTSGGNKTVDLTLFRDAAQLDASYRGRIGSGGGQVQELPATLHVLDASGAGTYTFTLKARASAKGATATVRRLTVIELL